MSTSSNKSQTKGEVEGKVREIRDGDSVGTCVSVCVYLCMGVYVCLCVCMWLCVCVCVCGTSEQTLNLYLLGLFSMFFFVIDSATSIVAGGPWTHRWHGPTKTHLCRCENVPAIYWEWHAAKPRTASPTYYHSRTAVAIWRLFYFGYWDRFCARHLIILIYSVLDMDDLWETSGKGFRNINFLPYDSQDYRMVDYFEFIVNFGFAW